MKILATLVLFFFAGFLLFVAFCAVLAQGADKHHGSVDGQEMAAATTLKSAIMVAETYFQDRHYLDLGHPGIGEYGFMSECSGLVPVQGRTLDLLDEQYRSVRPEKSGFQFIVYLPDGPQTAVADPYPLARHFSATAAALRERYFVAYAWPMDPNQGRRVLAIDQTGNIYARAAADFSKPPPWYALYGSAYWGMQPADGWEHYHR